MKLKQKKNKGKTKQKHLIKVKSVEKELNIVLFSIVFGIISLMLFSSVTLGFLNDDKNNKADTIITGFATSANKENSANNKNNDIKYEIKLKYSPEFLINVDFAEINILKKNILMAINNIENCNENGNSLQSCIAQEQNDFFSTDCETKLNTVDRIGLEIEKCKNSPETTCVCSLDFSSINNENIHIVNLNEISSFAIYNYNEKLALSAEKNELDENKLNEYLDNSLLIRESEIKDNSKSNLIYNIEKDGGDISINSDIKKYTFDKNKVLLIKENGYLNLLDNDIVNSQIDNQEIKYCELKGSQIINFCTKKEYSFKTGNGIKKSKIDFVVDFSK